MTGDSERAAPTQQTTGVTHDKPTVMHPVIKSKNKLYCTTEAKVDEFEVWGYISTV